MKIKLIIIFLLTIVQISWTQECDFEIRSLSNKLNGETQLIDKSEYEKVSEATEKYIDYTPMSEHNLIKKYPEIFKLRDSCYTFRTNPNNRIGINMDELKACKNKVQSKEYSDFKFKGIYPDNALIEVTGYEHWGFLLVDLKNGFSCYTMGKPLTSDGINSISYSNYYGDEEIALTNLKTKTQYVIGIKGWRTIESKVIKGAFYLKLEPEFHTKCNKEMKFLKIKN